MIRNSLSLRVKNCKFYKVLASSLKYFEYFQLAEQKTLFNSREEKNVIKLVLAIGILICMKIWKQKKAHCLSRPAQCPSHIFIKEVFCLVTSYLLNRKSTDRSYNTDNIMIYTKIFFIFSCDRTYRSLFHQMTGVIFMAFLFRLSYIQLQYRYMRVYRFIFVSTVPFPIHSS